MTIAGIVGGMRGHHLNRCYAVVEALVVGKDIFDTRGPQDYYRVIFAFIPPLSEDDAVVEATEERLDTRTYDALSIGDKALIRVYPYNSDLIGWHPHYMDARAGGQSLGLIGQVVNWWQDCAPEFQHS